MNTVVIVPALAAQLVDDMARLWSQAHTEQRREASTMLLGARFDLLKAIATWDEAPSKPAKKPAVKHPAKRSTKRRKS